MRKVFVARTFMLLGSMAAVCFAPACVLAQETAVMIGTPVLSGLSLPRTGQIATYDQLGKLIDFQGSGQDGEFQRGAVWPDPRFIINRNGTVSDSLTGLMWFKDGNCFGDLPWLSALKAVTDFNQGEATCHDIKNEYHDWFLPDLNQLASLLDAQAKVPSDSLRLDGFTGVQNGVYWSATAYHGRLNAWGVDFTNGAIDLHNKLDRHLLIIARKDTLGKKIAIKGSRPVDLLEDENNKSLSKSDQRYIDNGDGTVTDARTGLMWLQDGSCLPKLDWQGALTSAKLLDSGQGSSSCSAAMKQYADWSLPNAIELKSLIDYKVDYPALSAGHPFKAVAPSGYWTSTSVAGAPEQAFMIDCNTGAMRPTLKTLPYHVLAVRQAVVPMKRSRKESDKSGNLGVDEQYVLALDPAVPSEIDWPPSPRFFNNGDGTSMDAISGITWLSDANCLGKKKWKEAAETLKKFNINPKQFKCADYEVGFDDWQMPTLAEIKELFNKDEKNNAEWLNQQGIKNVQANASYWTATETPLNLYFADAISLKTGKAGNYPKSLQFIIWPKRKPQKGEEKSTPLLNMTANTVDNLVTLSPKDPISLAVYLHTFVSRIPADFWFWYDTPNEKRLWLTHIRTWTDKVTPVYQGPLFNLKNYEIYRSVAGLAPGVYDFHFALDTLPNGIFDEPRYEVKTTIIVTDSQ